MVGDDMDNIPPSVTQYSTTSLTVIHHSLRASRRRLVVGLLAHRFILSPSDSALSRRDGQQGKSSVSVRQIAREIVSIENEVPLAHATGEPYHNVYTSLIQTHLPKLDDIDAIQYQSDRKLVSPGRNLPALALIAGISSPAARILFHSTTSGTESDIQSTLKNSSGN